MALPVTIPNEFANATASIPLSQLDTNFNTLANVVNEINAGTQQLSNANVAILIVNAGTSAAPTITTTGDTNTGIFFPAADTIAFTEGGVEAARFDSAGNFGLGVTPSAWTTASSTRAMQFPGGGTIWGQNFAGNNPSIQVASNAYLDSGGYKYFQTAEASQYQQNAGTHVWQTAASGTAGNAISFTQAMTLDASGNLSLGSTSNASRLDVTGADNLGPTLVSRVYSLNRTAFLGFGFNTISANSNASGLFLEALGANPMAFSTNGTERARITSDGRFEVNYSTNNGNSAALFTNSAATTGNQFGPQVILSSDPNNGSNYFLQCIGTNTNRTTILSNGGIQNFSANDANLSDRREKTNFAPAKSYLQTICAIPVQTFNYIDQNHEEDPGLTLGVVAQDVQEVAPELVMESNWGTKEEPKMRLSIYQTDLQYALMKSIQELKAELDTVKAELATLKGT
jgi:hypothetical protein